MNARLWRQGQRSVFIFYHILTQNTVDADVLAALSSKNVTQEKLIVVVKAQVGDRQSVKSAISNKK